MKKLLILCTLLIFSATQTNAQDVFFDGLETKYSAYQSLTTAERNALTPTFGTTIRHENGGSEQLEFWDGANWLPFGGSGVASTGLEALDEGNGIGYKLINVSNANPLGFGAINFNTLNNSGRATGSWSVAFSDGVATGMRSFAANIGQATGNNSFAFGQSTVSSGSRAITLGAFLTAPSDGETTLGSIATTYVPDGILTTASGDRRFNIGNGSNVNTPIDAFTILKNGQTGVGINNFEANATGERLQVNGTVKATAFVGDGSGLTGIGLGSLPSQEIGYGDGSSIVSNPDFVYNPNLNNLTVKNGFFGSSISGTSFRMTESNGNFIEMAYLNGDPTLKLYKNGFGALIKAPTLTADRDVVIQDGDGTLAFLSDISVGNDILPLDNVFTGTNSFNGPVVKLLTSDAPLFNSKVFISKNETNTSGFTATQYAGIDRGSGTGTMWADVIVMNDNSTSSNASGGSVVDFKQLDLENGGALQYGYGRETNVRHRGSRAVDFLNGHTIRVHTDGSGSPIVNTVIRGISTDVGVKNTNTVVNGDVQGWHNTMNFTGGTINGDVQGTLIDWDYSGTSSNYTITGRVSGFEMGPDFDGLVAGGTKRFFYNRSTQRSDTDGLIFSNASVATHEAAGANVLLNRATADNRYLQSVVAGTNVTVDNTDPANPIINASGGGSSPITSVFKASDESRSNTATITADSDLVLPLEANSYYVIDVYVKYRSQGTPDYKFQFLAPSGSSGTWSSDLDTPSAESRAFSYVQNLNGFGSSNMSGYMKVMIKTTTAGDFSYGWAQQVSTVDATIVYEGSSMIATKLN